MDPTQLFDYIVPILFVVFFIVSKIFAPKEEESTDQPSEQTLFDDLYNEDDDSIEQEIQRKIRQRQQGDYNSGGWQPVPVPSMPVTPPQPAVPLASAAANNYSNELQEQYRRLEESRRLLEEQRKKARRLTKKKSPSQARQLPEASLALALRNKQNIRQAIMTYEIIGAPLSLRDNGKIKPSWEN